ncbi:MAG: hypothetical protein R3246_06365, partial [Acidimicrobiia bacterium]|nr:hypothetical protein [Acidimicrobiia bacterium]
MRAGMRCFTRRGRHVGEATGSPAVGLAVGDPLAAFRAAVMHRSVPVLAATVVALAVVALADGMHIDVASAAFLGTTLVGLCLATRIPWERVAETRDSWAAWSWSVAVALVLGGLALVPPLAASTRPFLAAVVVMTGLVLSPVRHLSVTVLTLALVSGSHLQGAEANLSEVLGPVLVVGVMAGAVAFAAAQLERTAQSDRAHVLDLEAERAAYQRLYDVASTL